MLFDGVDEYVSVPKNAAMDFERTSTFSVRFWIKFTGTGNRTIIGNSQAGPGARGLAINTSAGNRIYIYFMSEYGGAGGFIQTGTGTTHPLNDGTWQHVVITYDGSSVWTGFKIYFGNTSQTLNNADAGSLSDTTISTQAWGIGRNPHYSYAPVGLDGNLDEVIFYNSVLTQAQVTALFSTTVDPSALDSYGNMISWYRMGDLDDDITQIKDRKGTNHGTPINLESGDIVVDAPA